MHRRKKKKNRKPKREPVYRYGVASIQEIMPFLGMPRKLRILNQRVEVSSERLLTYKYKGMVCEYCGVRGAFFAVERNGGPPHLNLYGYNKHGYEVLLTSDHIIPRSKGGPDSISNRRCLCTICNRDRGCTIRWEQLSLPLVWRKGASL